MQVGGGKGASCEHVQNLPLDTTDKSQVLIQICAYLCFVEGQ